MSGGDPGFDLVVVGAGPGGYVAAIRAAQLGLKVACVDKEAVLGGTCLRVGCIPSKALLESSQRYEEARSGALLEHGVVAAEVRLDLARMMRRKEEVVQGLGKGVEALFRKNGVARIAGKATLLGPGRLRIDGPGEPRELDAPRVLLATGSRPASLSGVEVDGAVVCTSSEALSFTAVPRHLVVIGAGYIGLELGSVWRRLGAKVTVLEYLDRILPGTDAEVAEAARRALVKQGLDIQLSARVLGARKDGDGAVVEVEGREPIRADRVLLATGRVPVTEGLGLEAAGVKALAGGRIEVDVRFQAAPGVYAVGDLIRGPMLAHKAEEEGIACVEGIVTGSGHVEYDAIPGVVYTHPEVATVGKSEEDLVRDGVAYRKGVFPFRANARARALGDIDGLVKVLAAADPSDRLLGVHVIGPRAGDLIAEAALALAFQASSEDLARTCHAHPTLSEALREACLAVSARAIHT